ncbi:unnamed protein product [Enterobius vermicularis]|uniref:Protein kinase domain-containing protein n=1 Tax=Enterobius vermicularis TaxID=51028 RepID=A0A0N4VFN1_ENTVE|nr:unnamed protein product [Enterobius vermicularis]
MGQCISKHSSPLNKEPFFGAYTDKKELGRGGFGVVYKDGSLAVKVRVTDKSCARREVKFLKRCAHQNVVEFVDFCKPPKENAYYIIMEYMEGGTLAEVSKKQNLTEHQVRKIIRDVATAVKHLHSKDVVHTDIKPANILCSKNGEIWKLGDFGSAHHYSLIGKIFSKTYAVTRQYAAPETVAKKCYGKSVDIWSIGVVMYELLFDKLPFEETNDRKLEFTLQFPSEKENFVSENAKDLIKKLLVKEPSRRLTVDGILQHPWILNNLPDQKKTEKEKYKSANATER